ncbi:cytochrome P450 [Pseudomonadota bacterium]
MNQKDDLPLPQGVQLTAIDEEFRKNPYSLLANLRQRAPVLNDAQLGRLFFTRHDDVKNILRHKGFFSDPRKANPGSFSREFLGANLGENEEPSMLLMDEPGHRRLRSLVSSPFTPAAVERWRPRTREVVQRVLDDISGDEFDLIAEFAGPIPTVVIAELLGIDSAMHAQFKTWSDKAVQIGFNPFPSEQQLADGTAAMEALRKFFHEEIERRSATPGEDLLSDMIRAEADGEKLTIEEIVTQCNLLLVAGNVTTTDLIGNGIKALLDFPDQLQKLREAPALIGNAVEEMLRFDSPVTNSGRIAHEDMEIGGCPVKKGESLSTSLAAANRDPAVYPDPDRFDIEREDTHHQAFGGGRHLCLGAHLARLEAQESILGLLQRFPRLAHSQRGYVYHAIPSFRGLGEFWVRG